MYNKDIIAILLEYVGYSAQFRLLSLYNMSVIKFTGYLADYLRYGKHLFYNSRYQLCDNMNLYKRMKLVHKNYFEMNYSMGLEYKCEFITISEHETNKSNSLMVQYTFIINSIKLVYKLYRDDYVTMQYITTYDRYSDMIYGRKYKPGSQLYKFMSNIHYNIISNRL